MHWNNSKNNSSLWVFHNKLSSLELDGNNQAIPHTTAMLRLSSQRLLERWVTFEEVHFSVLDSLGHLLTGMWLRNKDQSELGTRETYIKCYISCFLPISVERNLKRPFSSWSTGWLDKDSITIWATLFVRSFRSLYMFSSLSTDCWRTCKEQVRLVSVKVERPNHPSRSHARQGGGSASQEGGQPAGGVS